MKYGIIDVGSNSVRLLITDGVFFNKQVKTTRLSENMGAEYILQEQAMERTADAIYGFFIYCKTHSVEKIYIFATEALRKAKNKKIFLDRVKTLTNLSVDVIDGNSEAEIGTLGALSNNDGGVIDIGGASSEIIVRKNGNTIYSKSVDVGAVKVKDFCGQDKNKASLFVVDKIKQYGKVSNAVFYAIGGTATSLASVIMELEPYDPDRVDGFILTYKDCCEIEERLYSLTVEQREKLKGLQRERAEIISCGALILENIMKSLDIKQIIVSEKDNLEGYYFKKVKND